MNYIVNGDSLTGIASAIRTKGGTSEQLTFPEDFVSGINALSAGGSGASVTGSDVNFYDYTGDIVYSYTAEEFAELTELPANPVHEGLTSQGWNWSLSDAQEYVAECGILDIGQMYIPTDGKTHVLVHVDNDRVSYRITLLVSGSVTVDWGDGSTPDTITGNNDSLKTTPTHTYTAFGDYDITLDVTGSARTQTSDGSYSFLHPEDKSHSDTNFAYSSTIRQVHVGQNLKIDANAFKICRRMKYLTFPHIPGSAHNLFSMFTECHDLRCIIIPPDGDVKLKNAVTSVRSLKVLCLPASGITLGETILRDAHNVTRICIPPGITELANSVIGRADRLSEAALPDGVTTIDANFSYSYALTKITFPASVTSMGAVCMGCSTLKTVRMLPTTPPTLTSDQAFISAPNDLVIEVPAQSLEAYKAATNWSRHAGKMVGV